MGKERNHPLPHLFFGLSCEKNLLYMHQKMPETMPPDSIHSLDYTNWESDRLCSQCSYLIYQRFHSSVWNPVSWPVAKGIAFDLGSGSVQLRNLPRNPCVQTDRCLCSPLALASTSCISVSTSPLQHPPAWKTANPQNPPKKPHAQHRYLPDPQTLDPWIIAKVLRKSDDMAFIHWLWPRQLCPVICLFLK